MTRGHSPTIIAHAQLTHTTSTLVSAASPDFCLLFHPVSSPLSFIFNSMPKARSHHATTVRQPRTRGRGRGRVSQVNNRNQRATRNRHRSPSPSPPRGEEQSSPTSAHARAPDTPGNGNSGDLSSLTLDQLVEVIRAEVQRASTVNEAPAPRDPQPPPASQGYASN